MAELDSCLHRLVSDPEQLERALSLAQMILDQQDAPLSDAKEEASPAPSEADVHTSEFSKLLLSLLELLPGQTGSPAQCDQSEESESPFCMTELLPQLLQMFTGGKSLVKEERVQLLEAVRPYLKEDRAHNIDRAVKMANTAKAAASLMHMFRR